MEPALRDGDHVIIERGRQPAIGDIAVFDKDGRTIVHRIVTTKPLRQMGDAAHRGSKLNASSVVGVGLVAVRDGRAFDLRSPGARWNGRWQAARAVTRHVRGRMQAIWRRPQPVRVSKPTANQTESGGIS